MSLERLNLELSIRSHPLVFAHLRYEDGENVHEILDDGPIDYNIGELRMLDDVPYAIVQIYAHAFGKTGDEVDPRDLGGIALAVLVTLVRVDVVRVSDPRASFTTS